MKLLTAYAVDLRETEKWRALAECRGAPMEWFVGDPSPPTEAFALCDRCYVAGECLAFGEEEHKRNGVVAIYGGKLFCGKSSKLDNNLRKEWVCLGADLVWNQVSPFSDISMV